MKSAAIALSILSVAFVGGASFWYSNCGSDASECGAPAAVSPASATPVANDDCGGCPTFDAPSMNLNAQDISTQAQGGCPTQQATPTAAKTDCATKAQAVCDTEDCPPEDCLPTAKAQADDCCPGEATKVAVKADACCPEEAAKAKDDCGGCEETASN